MLGLYDLQLSTNALVDRKRAKAMAVRMRTAILGDRYQASLVNILRGTTGEQRSWTDPALRRYATDAVVRHFGDDINWCTQVMLTLYLLDPQSADDIDAIVEQHVESRTGAFAPALYEGKGWNPARAIYFNADTHRFWRIYRAFAHDRWQSTDGVRNWTNPADGWVESDFRLSGTRGCVTHLELSRYTEMDAAPDYAATFIRQAEPFVWKALRQFPPQQLWAAVSQQAVYEERIGAVRVYFRVSNVQGDRGEKDRREFYLSLDHDK